MGMEMEIIFNFKQKFIIIILNKILNQYEENVVIAKYLSYKAISHKPL